LAGCGDREAESTFITTTNFEIEMTDTEILLGNKEDFRSIYSIAFGLVHSIVSHSPDTVRFSPNSLIQPSNPSEIL
jgi:hypothetical protein